MAALTLLPVYTCPWTSGMALPTCVPTISPSLPFEPTPTRPSAVLPHLPSIINPSLSPLCTQPPPGPFTRDTRLVLCIPSTSSPTCHLHTYLFICLPICIAECLSNQERYYLPIPHPKAGYLPAYFSTPPSAFCLGVLHGWRGAAQAGRALALLPPLSQPEEADR
eukprot:510339-Pleurochrysis_carterae.AAC.1